MEEIAVTGMQAREVEALISFIRSRNRLSYAETALLEKKRRPNYLEDSEAQIASKLGGLLKRENPLWFLSGASEEVREFLRHRDNDLAFQIETVKGCFAAYFRDGEVPPPYYPYRIAVILRKAGLHSLERSFLEAWVSHFPGDGGGRNAVLQERLAKILMAHNKPSGSN